MLIVASLMLSNPYPLSTLTTTTTKFCHHSPWINVPCPFLVKHPNKSKCASLSHSTIIPLECEAQEIVEKEESGVKWHDVGSDITESQKDAISQLPPKMSNRCKALMKRIICFSEDENLALLLAAWVKTMKPRRCDWLSILKEMKRSNNPLLLEVMEYALLEDSFEAAIHDYTKLIDTYAKRGRLESAENALQAMKNRGFPSDQVILTVMIHMYSKAGDLDRAKEAFEEIQLLGVPLDKRAYGAMIMAYVRAGSPDLAEGVMLEMEAEDMYAGREVYKALLRAYSLNGDANGAQRVFDAIQFAGIVPDSKLCALLVNAYCASGNSDKARSVIENMRSAGLQPSGKCVALILGAYEREDSPDKALAFLMELENDGVSVDEEASEVLDRWLEKLGVADGELQDVLRRFSPEKGRGTEAGAFSSVTLSGNSVNEKIEHCGS